MTTVAELLAGVQFVWIDTDDLQGTGRTYIEMRGTGENITLPAGGDGEPGPPGPSAPRFQWLGNVASENMLPRYFLAAEAGSAYVALDSQRLWVWDGALWQDKGRLRGPQGPAGVTHSIIDVEFLEPFPGTISPKVDARIVGPPGQETLSLTVPHGRGGPTGDPGRPGDAGPITSSPGFPYTAEELNGYSSEAGGLDLFPVWKNDHFYPSYVIPDVLGVYGFGPEAFVPDSVGLPVTTNKRLGTFAIPGQQLPYRPLIVGQHSMIGGYKWAKGAAINYGHTHAAMWSVHDTADAHAARITQPIYPQTGIDLIPTTPTGLIPGGLPVTLHLESIGGAGGSGTWAHYRANSYLMVICVAVTDEPLR